MSLVVNWPLWLVTHLREFAARWAIWAYRVARSTAVAASLTQEDQNLAMVFSGSSLTDTSTTYSVGGIDSCVYRQAACGDEAAGRKFADRSISEFPCLASVGADLRGADGSRAHRFRH